MNSIYDFIIRPVDKRYNNTKTVNNKKLILNTSIENFKAISTEAIVVAIPLAYNQPVKVGDKVIIHHNVFRRWYDMKGKEKNSRSYFKEDLYFCSIDQIYLYKKQEWLAMPGYSFVQPIKSNNKLTSDVEQPLVGIVKYTDGNLNVNTLVGFTPNSEYEFVIEGKRLYRVLNKFITIKYEYQGNEEEYNPSWAQSG